MHNTMPNKAEDHPECLVIKRPYQRPELQVFGKVLHLTQGSGGHGNDNPTQTPVLTKHDD